jgi:hypothetical protein
MIYQPTADKSNLFFSQVDQEQRVNRPKKRLSVTSISITAKNYKMNWV